MRQRRFSKGGHAAVLDKGSTPHFRSAYHLRLACIPVTFRDHGLPRGVTPATPENRVKAARPAAELEATFPGSHSLISWERWVGQ